MYSSQGQIKWVQGIDICHSVTNIKQHSAHSGHGAQINWLAQNASLMRKKLQEMLGSAHVDSQFFFSQALKVRHFVE